ncbi:hypothetical protein WJX73_001568 [Symbiochloris irregularis]|uniref:F-box domain-containing protein n=1 Tax=Symbiochloris irregularis TaxID=706552 RepID=A0AAW1Q3G7_9CHLO
MRATLRDTQTGVGEQAMTSSFLNPQAREFVPRGCTSLHRPREGFYSAPAPSTLLRASAAPGSPAVPRVLFQDLPDQVISVILGLLDIASVGSCLTVCKRVTGLVSEAPLAVSVAASGLSEQTTPLPELRRRLQSICICLPGIRELDLSSSPVEDTDVLHALASLKRLQLLQLEGCKKLTRNLVSLAISQGLLPQLVCLGLQRCFQLDVTVILQLLSAPADADTRLSVLLLSHIILLKWPVAGGTCSPSTWQLGRSPPAVASATVIDLFTSEGVQAMSALLAGGLGGLQEAGTCFQLQGQLPARQLKVAVEAAVNCSSPSRHTPLHLAAAHGRHADVQAVLRMGARSDCTDRSGATPLFSACELGHGECLDVLLGAELGVATVSKSNAAGESPLYIAALRGHEACVDRLLKHILKHSLPWMDKELYGDCWTPLMAAAVADHCGIVVRLLAAAGPHARTIARQTNRNGSTAAHVAARRGCMPVLHELLAAAGGALASTRDHRCKTPIQVAEREGQWAAAAMLRAAVRVH